MDLDHLTKALRGTLFRLQPNQADSQLLERFLTTRDQTAFEELVRRHGPMVLQVCRRVLGHHQDAEDAFQGTFVLLARKASSVARMASVGGWLHGVALRTALNARKLRARRTRPSGSAAEANAVAATTAGPGQDLQQLDLNSVLDEELERLPERYRVPVVLCYLEGKTVEATAQQLGWPSGTVKTQLSRARELLRDRLSRRGVTLGASGLATVLLEGKLPAALPDGLIASTAQGAAQLAVGGEAAGQLAPGVSKLAGMTLQTATARKLRWTLLVLLGLGGLGVALTWGIPWSQPAQQTRPELPELQNVTSLVRRGSPIRAAAFARDERTVAFLDYRGAVTLMEVDYLQKAGQPRRELEDSTAAGRCLAFSPDGTRLAVACNDNGVRLWDWTAGKQVATLTGGYRGAAKHNEVMSVAFTPDGQTLAASVPGAGITLWDLRTNRLKGQLPLPGDTAVEIAFTADSTELVAIRRSDFRVVCWNLATLGEKPLGAQPTGQALALTVDARSALLLREDSSLHWWDWTTGQAQLFCHLQNYRSPGFLVSPRGDTLLAASSPDYSLLILDLKERKKLFKVSKPFPGGVTCMKYSRDGSKFLYSGVQEEIKPGMETVPIMIHIVDIDACRQQPLLSSP